MTILTKDTPAGAGPPDRLWEGAPSITAGGNAPLRLAAEGVWRVEAGKVEVKGKIKKVDLRAQIAGELRDAGITEAPAVVTPRGSGVPADRGR